MLTLHAGFRAWRAPEYALLVGAACFSLYYGVLRPVVKYEHVRAPKVCRSRARDVAAAAAAANMDGDTQTLPYPPDAFPGARHVETAYGGIQVFEWGPEDGEKVLLLHGLGTPCVALGDMAWHLVGKGYRVMLFDYFGRGYSDAPTDLIYDDRLYTTQILLVLASSPLPWTGPAAFHILGYSLGGALVASFAAHHANLLRSATLVCPGGLVRPSHVSFKSRLLYSEAILPTWISHLIARRQLEPKKGAPSADIPDPAADEDFDRVLIRNDNPLGPRVGDVVRWQLRSNPGFVHAYMSSIRNSPIYGQHEGALWTRLRDQLALRRTAEGTPGLASGRICLIVAERDPIVIAKEWTEDSVAVLGKDGVDIHVLPGGHEIAISKGAQVAEVAISTWQTPPR